MNDSGDPSTRRHAVIAATLSHNAPCGFLVIDPKERVLYANSTLGRWLGRDTHDMEDGGKLGQILTASSHLYYQTQIAPMIQLQGFAREIACKLRTTTRDRALPVLMNAILRDTADGPRIEIAFFDTTERHRFEEQLRAARAEAEELAAIVRQATVGIMRCDMQGRIGRMNDAAAAMLGTAPGQLPDTPIEHLLKFDGDHDDWFRRATVEIAETGTDVRFDASVGAAHYNVSVAEIANPGEPYADADFSVILRDITQHVLSEQRSQLLVGELDHRIQNVFAVVIGMVRQTIHASSSERDALTARLMSLSASHQTLTRNYWQDADIRNIVDPIVAQAGDRQTVRLTGPEVRLAPNQFKALSMAVHELATNARKYGALSADEGVVEIDWTLGDDDARAFTFRWRERGGPEVSPPESSGFGTVMIEKVLAAEFQGTTEASYRPEGLEFECRGLLEQN